MNLEHQRKGDLYPSKLVAVEKMLEYDTLGPGQFELEKPIQYQSGALFYFLYRAGGPEYKKRLKDFLKKMKRASESLGNEEGKVPIGILPCHQAPKFQKPREGDFL